MASAEVQAHFRLLAVAAPETSELLRSGLGRFREVLDFESDWASVRQRLDSTRYDVLLVELRKASQDLIHELREGRRDLRIIVLGRDTTAQSVIDAIRAEVFCYFSEPYDMSALASMIEQAVHAHDWSGDIELQSADPNYLTLTLRCAISTADRLVQFMTEMPSGLSDDDRRDVAMAFREMLLNAIEHGGKLNPEERVRVSRVRTRRTIVYHVIDSGEGFCREGVAHAAFGSPDDPLAHVAVREEAGMRYGGFGLLIARSLVDEVIYNEQGNEVILIKYLL